MIIEYDLMVTWRLPDGATDEYPATRKVTR